VVGRKVSGYNENIIAITKTFPHPSSCAFIRLKHVATDLWKPLSIKVYFPVVETYDKEQIKKGGVYLAPSNYHMSVGSRELFFGDEYRRNVKTRGSH